jgi:hypothetical protein
MAREAEAGEGSMPDRSTEEIRTFRASRLTSGNLLFPTEISVSPIRILRRKRSWVSADEESINIRHVASVRIKTGILFSDIWIESSGGANQIGSHGHSKADAQEIKRLIEEYQLALNAAEVPVTDVVRGEPLRSCPWCAETIKAAAKICRFCRREVG